MWEALKIETSLSPEISLLQRFKDNYSSITYNDQINFKIPECPEGLQATRENVIDMCRQFSKKDNAFDRGDYRELVSLTLLYLNADNYENNLKQPGALHHAQQMAKLLYSIKMDLLGDKIINELPKGSIFCRNQRNLIHRFVTFIIYCYVPWWLTAPISSSTPENDLHLINSIIHFSQRPYYIKYCISMFEESHVVFN